MISRRPLYAALVLSMFACGDSYDYDLNPPTTEQVKTPLPNDCVNPTVRNELGTMETGLKTIRIRARIAQNSLGAVALDDETQIANDLHVLNTRFESSNLRFLLDNVELSAKDDAVYQATSNPLCNEAFKPLADDSIPMLYVGNLVFSSGQVRGTGNACGAVINARTTDSKFENISGIFSNTEAVPRMMGYVLGLLQTHACYNIHGYENDPQLSGDLVADTPFDPGPANTLLTCGGTTAPGKCVFIDEAGCYIQCADGSMPDVHNIMSSYTGCRNQFSKDQSVYMRCAVELHHAHAKCDNVWGSDFGKDWWASDDGVQIGDVDGDGRGDAILHYDYPPPATWRVALSTGSQFAPSAIWSEGFGDHMVNVILGRMVADVDGDGKADAVIKGSATNATWFVALSTGTSFSTPSVWIENHYGLPMLADVDADGRADAVVFAPDAGRWSVALSTGSAFATPAVWVDGFGVEPYGVKLGDVDGDGKADAIAFRKFKSPKLESMCKWEVARSTGNAFSAGETWYEHNCPDYQRWMLGDVDGDKKLDLVVYRYDIASWFVHLSTGAGFGPPHLAIAGLGGATSPSNPYSLVGDVDGNNKADFVAFDATRNMWTTNICRPEGSAD